MDTFEERIRRRALEIWAEEGRPEGREYSHWLRARAELTAEDADDERDDACRGRKTPGPDGS